MTVVTLQNLKQQVTLAERTHAVTAAKARSGSLALKTRQKYLRIMPKTQSTMIHARSELSKFIERQKEMRKF